MRSYRCRTRVWLLTCLAFAACADRPGSTDAASEPQFGGTVVVNTNSDLDNVNSLVSQDKWTQEVNRFVIFLPLIRYSADLGFEPALAERWEMLGDTGVVFHLRRDVHWHDGTPTTARDVLFTFERAQDEKTGFPNLDYFERWTSATSPDSFTVRFSFEPHAEPLAGWPFLPIMPAHLLDSIPPERLRQAAFNKRPVGNGPFRFVEYRANDRWVFEANPDFPQALGGRPYVDRLVIRPIPDQTAQLTALLTGSTDVALTPTSEDYARVSQQPGIYGVVMTGRQYANVMWNGRVPPLDNPTVRRALAMAIDRRQIIETLRAGQGRLATGPIGPFHWAFDESLEPVPYDPDAARDLLREAGLADNDNDGILELPDGRPFQIELKIPPTPFNRDAAEMIRSNLAAVGVRVNTRQVEFATLIRDITSPGRDFQAIIMAWESDFRINLRDTFHSAALAGPFQVASYSNDRVDSLIDEVAVAYDRNQARPLYVEIQRILRDEQPWTFMFYYPDLVLVRDRVRGVEMDVRGALRTVQTWWVTDARRSADAPGSGDSAAHSPDPDSARSP